MRNHVDPFGGPLDYMYAAELLSSGAINRPGEQQTDVLIGRVPEPHPVWEVEFRDRETLARLRTTAMQLGVLTVTAGKEGKVLRHLMPLVITDDQLAETFAVFNEAAAVAVAAAAV